MQALRKRHRCARPYHLVRTWSEQVGVQSQTQARPETGAPPASASLPAVDPPHAPSRNHQPSMAIPAGGARASIQPADRVQERQHPDLCVSASGAPTQPSATPASTSLPTVDPPHAPLRNHQPSMAIPAGGARASIQPGRAQEQQHPEEPASQRRPRRGRGRRGSSVAGA